MQYLLCCSRTFNLQLCKTFSQFWGKNDWQNGARVIGRHNKRKLKKLNQLDSELFQIFGDVLALIWIWHENTISTQVHSKQRLTNRYFAISVQLVMGFGFSFFGITIERNKNICTQTICNPWLHGKWIMDHCLCSNTSASKRASE